MLCSIANRVKWSIVQCSAGDYSAVVCEIFTEFKDRKKFGGYYPTGKHHSYWDIILEVGNLLAKLLGGKFSIWLQNGGVGKNQ